MRFTPMQSFLAASLAAFAIPALAQADIVGFGDFSGFTVTQSDGNSAPTVSPGQIRLTNGAYSEDRSIFCDTPQNISSFTASFTYQVTNPSSVFGGGGGAALVIQDSSAGASAVGNSTVGSSGITNSAATTLELYASSSASGFYTNGAATAGSPSTSPVSLISGDPINVTLSYNGSILTETLVDTVTSDTYSSSSLANIASIVGGSAAYIGITAADTGNEAADQDFSNFSFVSGVPEPASLGLLGIGAVVGLTRRRRR